MTLKNHGFFVLRTSRLTEQEYLSLNHGKDHAISTMSDDLTAIIKVSSSSLFSSLERERQCIKNGKEKKSKKNLTSLLRTTLRASFRATPYGLSSCCTLGIINKNDNLVISQNDKIIANIELSGEVILNIINHLNTKNVISKAAYMKTNPTIYTIGNRVRYIAIGDFSNGSYKYCERTISDVDKGICDLLKDKKRVYEIHKYLEANFPHENRHNYIKDALSSGFIVPELALPIHRRDGVGFIINYLKLNHPDLKLEIQALNSLLQTLLAAKMASFSDVTSIQNKVISFMEDIGVNINDKTKTFILVDAIRNMSACSLSSITIERLLSNVNNLIKKTTRLHPLHENLARKILERFGEEAIPFGFLVDPKYGISFEPASIKKTPLTDSNDGNINDNYEKKLTFFLMNAIVSGCAPINLADFKRTINTETIFPKGAVLAQARHKDGSLGFSILSVSGPEGLELFARMGLVDSSTEQCMKVFLEKSKIDHTEKVDVAHIPSAKGWHAAMRPKFWQKNILFPGVYVDGPFLSCENIFVRVENGIIILQEKSGKRLLPRISCSHDMLNADNLPLYRALACIGAPYTVGFDWPSFFSCANQLPRVILDDIWLAPAQWKLTDQERNQILSSKSISKTLCDIFHNRGISGEIEVGKDDKFLPILDYKEENISVILPILKSRDAIIRERFVTTESSIFQHGNKNIGEIVVPFSHTIEMSEKMFRDINLNNYSFQATHPHLSHWISFKIYCHQSDMDMIILNGLATLSEEIKNNNYADSWFFLRFSDPDFHLRFRIKVTDIKNRPDVTVILGEFLDKLSIKCFVNRWEIDTYHPEQMRYGGETTTPICEKIFTADSKICWLFNKTRYNIDNTSRHIVNAKILLDRLNLMKINNTHSNDILKKWRESYSRIITNHNEASSEANNIVNKNRGFLQTELSEILPKDTVTTYLSTRTLITQIGEEAISGNTTMNSESLLDSFFHMFSNRLYPDWSRRNEFIALCLARRILNFNIHKGI